MHNVHFLLQMMGNARQAIIDDRYPAFLKAWFKTRFGVRDKIPGWAVGALKGVGVDLLEDD